MKKFIVGCQLYSVRDEMAKDVVGTLKKVKQMGYDYVEFTDFFGYTAEALKEILDDIGLCAVNVHHDPYEFIRNPKASVKYLKKLGIKYATISSLPVDRHAGTDEFEKTIKDVIAAGRILHEAGLTLLYHNHDFEFLRYQDKFLLDWLYDTVPAEFLQTQIDTCWVSFAGVDVCEYLLKYKDRSPILHLKDFYADGDLKNTTGRHDTTRNNFSYRPLGMGIQDIPAILDAAERAGTEIIMVEQDESPDRGTLEDAKISRDYLKSLGI